MITKQICIGDLGPSTGDQRHIIGADPGLMVSGNPGHNITEKALDSKRLTVNSVYALTNSYDYDVRQSFNEMLQAVVDSILKSHFLALGMDANAKLRKGLPTSRNFGPFANDVQCEKGALLRSFCVSHNLTGANTFSQHRLKQGFMVFSEQDSK